MAQFFKIKQVNSLKKKIFKGILIEKYDHKGQGIAIFQNKPLFIKNGLQGEKLDIEITESKKRFNKGIIKHISNVSPLRIKPKCMHYDDCGGCDFQHCNSTTERNIKETGLQNLFKRFAKLAQVNMVNTLFDAEWGYRRTARFGLQFNRKTNILSMGFRRKETNTLIDQQVCPVLISELEILIKPLKKLLNALPSKAQLSHVKLLFSDVGAIVLLRHLQPLTCEDIVLINAFSQQKRLNFYAQPSQGQISRLFGEKKLIYQLPAWDCQFNFKPTDFLQINEKINQKMVEQAINWLALDECDDVLDLFCGLGNFTLPIARIAKQVVGIEGVQTMVDRADKNAQLNNIENASFHQADLNAQKIMRCDWARQSFNKVLLDPSRAGAFECMNFIISLKPTHIVYVSCDPVTLARDSKQLLDAGYHLDKLGLLDMFPQTSHIESMALFKVSSSIAS